MTSATCFETNPYLWGNYILLCKARGINPQAWRKATEAEIRDMFERIQAEKREA